MVAVVGGRQPMRIALGSASASSIRASGSMRFISA
jgi:hypothetical protein